MTLTANQLNFSGGPGALPDSVLRQLQEAILEVPGTGLSILGMSHRSDWFAGVVYELENNIQYLMGLPSSTRVLFLQGGATHQFAMLPMNLLRDGVGQADYLHTGYWSGKAIAEAGRCGKLRTVWSGEKARFYCLPAVEELDLSPEAAYFHYVSNETVEGLQFNSILGREDVPRICDMSSDFLSAPGDFNRFSMIYAHAQKNIGPAGVTVVILKEKFLGTMEDNLPGFINYHSQARANSVYNTPPVFAIFAVLLVSRWLMSEVGGLGAMDRINTAKADLLYSALDGSDDYYRGRAHSHRSKMNVVFNLPTEEMERKFLEAARHQGFSGLEGHRSIGGIRASIYNGLTLTAVERLVEFMDEFRRANR